MTATLANILKACDERGIPAGVARRVVRELGGAKEAAGRLHDVSNHGASGGFSGFIYHTETAAFVRVHRASILAMLGALASDTGESVIEVVRGFNCLCDRRRPAALACDYSADEVGRALYGRVCDADAAILDALAWYALEEVARAWVDAGGES
jgi:hypothetical protein